MTFPLIAAFGQTVFGLLLGGIATFLILLVLVQRGRGGGLAGALGGMGGSSAFGAKAGDVFTKITIAAAAVWIVLCIAATKMTPESQSLVDTKVDSAATAEENPGVSATTDNSAEEGADTEAEDTAAEGSTEEADTEASPEAETETPAEDASE